MNVPRGILKRISEFDCKIDLKKMFIFISDETKDDSRNSDQLVSLIRYTCAGLRNMHVLHQQKLVFIFLAPVSLYSAQNMCLP